ncbi:MAG: glycoside hydrolase family 97 N-terminal domain-containing protein [Sedimentisphaerales bacterium]|nr:glycoside hydrolase family 97 N-terminal domain-containing protein [Sedimentisphaerales bacterium]
MYDRVGCSYSAGQRFVACIAAVLGLLNAVCAAEEGTATVKSPDGMVVITFAVKDIGGRTGCPVYSMAYKGRAILVDSQLGLELKDAESLEAGFEITEVARGSQRETWSPVYGERSSISDNYNFLVVQLRRTSPRAGRPALTFRAYDEGAVFCYTIPKQDHLDNFVISAEKTQFRFTANHTAWAVYSAQGQYSKVSLSEVKNNCERPMTIETADGLYVSIAEAGLVDYARMRLSPAKETLHTLVSSLGSEVRARTPLTTPWRVILVGESPGQLLERNYLLLNLNKPCAIEDTSWIKPGKVIREVTLTTTGGKACVDFAAEHNLQYVEFDAGWYGPENSDASDATTVTVDPKRSKGPLDLHAVIEYARERDIGILLYVNHKALERQIDEILPLYEKWGIKGVKYGFVNVGSQKWTSWLHDAVRKAAKHHLMVDIHDEYRPTGYSRTYPNLMTQEGIGGDETSPSNEQTLAILFTRMLAGAADNTICYYDGRVDRNASHAYQLAKAVCFYSPWQFLYWYDRPGGSPPRAGGGGGSRGGIGNEPELEFFDHVPTVWDETRVLHGSIGEYAVIARRSGEDWYVGCMNSGRERVLEIRPDFLDTNKKYTAHIYSDDASVKTRTHVRIGRRAVNAGSTLKAVMSAQGGQAIRIVPATDEDLKKYPGP